MEAHQPESRLRAAYTVSDRDPQHLHDLTNRYAANRNMTVRTVDVADAVPFQGLGNRFDSVVGLNVFGWWLKGRVL